jgi:hypothetical protein
VRPDLVSSRANLLGILAEGIGSLRVPNPARVAVDGPDAAGKTTFADELLGSLNDRRRSVIRAGIDGRHRPGPFVTVVEHCRATAITTTRSI